MSFLIALDVFSCLSSDLPGAITSAVKGGAFKQKKKNNIICLLINASAHGCVCMCVCVGMRLSPRMYIIVQGFFFFFGTIIYNNMIYRGNSRSCICIQHGRHTNHHCHIYEAVTKALRLTTGVDYVCLCVPMCDKQQYSGGHFIGWINFFFFFLLRWCILSAWDKWHLLTRCNASITPDWRIT